MKTDVIAELRARVAELEPLCAEKNGIIQRMGMRIKELEAEVLEQCRLNGMGSEREYALQGELSAKDRRIAELEEKCLDGCAQAETDAGIIESDGKEIHFLRQQLAAQALTIKTMRDALEYASIGSCSCLTKTPDPEFHSTLCKYRIIQKALALPDNSTEVLDKYTKPLNDQLAAQALTIKTMREALEKFIDSHEECTDLDGFTAQIVSMDDYHEAQEAISIPDNSTEVLDKYTKPLNDQLAAQALTIKTMREALNIWINIAANCSIESGCCCCGESMKNHSHPMSCGHSPVDMADSIAYEAIAETDKALAIPDNSTEILQEWLDKQLGEPVAVVSHKADFGGIGVYVERPDLVEQGTKLYATPHEAIIAAEQRAAEACAKYVNRFISGDGILNEVWISEIEEAIRSGEWRKYL